MNRYDFPGAESKKQSQDALILLTLTEAASKPTQKNNFEEGNGARSGVKQPRTTYLQGNLCLRRCAGAVRPTGGPIVSKGARVHVVMVMLVFGIVFGIVRAVVFLVLIIVLTVVELVLVVPEEAVLALVVSVLEAEEQRQEQRQ